jgi:hypothetical protein
LRLLLAFVQTLARACVIAIAPNDERLIQFLLYATE